MGISAAVAGILGEVGVGATTAGIIGTAAETGLIGAGIGAAGAGLTGGKILKGAEFGGLAGLGAGFGPAIGTGLGIGTTAGSALGGLAGGALGGVATGTDPLRGAIMGGIGGGLTGALGGFEPPSVSVTPQVFGSNPGGFLTTPGAGAVGAGSLAEATGMDAATLDDMFGTSATGTAGTGIGTTPGATGAPGGAGGAGATGGGGTAATGGGGAKGFFNKDIGGTGLTGRDLLAGGGLLMSAAKPSSLPGEKELSGIAGQLGTQGKDLASYLQSGNLPAGVTASLHSGTEAAKAALRSRFASMGMSGSTSEATALGNADIIAQTQGAQIAMNLLQSGVQESQLSAELYDLILRNSLQQDQELGNAISNFAIAMAGGNPQARAA